jgi:hypothetical protein
VNYEDELLSFIRRTRRNLELTEEWRREHNGAGFSEVTHLINSLLGLVVLPKERVLNQLRQVHVAPTGIPAWSVYFRLEPVEGKLPTELRPFLQRLRNSVAHLSLEFVSNGAEISGVGFVQRSRDRTELLWRAFFDLAQLRKFLACLTDEVERACAALTKTSTTPATPHGSTTL